MDKKLKAGIDALYLDRIKIEEVEQWREIADKIPWISFPPEWEVKIVPPWSWAVVRFRVRLASRPEDEISVYLDWHDKLGCMGQPYYEIYPAWSGGTERFLLSETDEMIKAIHLALGNKPAETTEEEA